MLGHAWLDLTSGSPLSAILSPVVRGLALTSLAQPVLAQTSTAPTGHPPSWVEMLQNSGFMLPLLVILVVFMIMTSRSRRQEERKKRELLDNIKRGDRIQTIGGVLGKVVEVEATKVLLKVDESSNTKIWFSRSAVSAVLGEDKAEAAGAK